MSDKNKLSGEAIDLAIQKLQMQKSVDDTVVLEKGMVVDKRAMGGATTTEDDESKTDVGREQKNVKNPELGRLPQSNLSGNFATKYKRATVFPMPKKKTPRTPSRIAVCQRPSRRKTRRKTRSPKSLPTARWRRLSQRT